MQETTHAVDTCFAGILDRLFKGWRDTYEDSKEASREALPDCYTESNGDVELGKLHVTYDHSLFKILNDNRSISETHVKNIRKRVLDHNLLSMNPVLVNSDFEIFEGQHRCAAATSLGEAIYYIVIELPEGFESDKSFVTYINECQKAWSLTDWIASYAEDDNHPNKEHYVTLRDLCALADIAPQTAACLLAGEVNKGISSDIKKGVFEVFNEDRATATVDALDAFIAAKKAQHPKDNFGWIKGYKCAMAFYKALCEGSFSMDRAMKNMLSDKSSVDLNNAQAHEGYLDSLVALNNYKRSRGSKLDAHIIEASYRQVKGVRKVN